MRLRIMGAMLGLWLGMGMASSAQAAWYQVKSRHFIVYSDGSQQQLELFATKLEKFDYLLRQITNAPETQQSTNPVRVFLLANRSRVTDLAHNPNIAGFYTTSDRFGLAILSRETKDHKFDLGAEEILFHEYTHHFMLENFPAAYPAWYVEGFAEFFSVITFQRDGGIQFGQVPLVRAPTLVNLSLYPLEQLFSRDTEGLSLQKGDQYYGTAWLVTHYFHYDEKRRVEFRHYLDDLTSGKKNIAIGDYFEGGLPALEKELRIYMRHRLSASVLKPQPIDISGAQASLLDPVQAALIYDELRLMGRRADAAQETALLQSVRQKAAQFPQSAYAATVLAEAEWGAGNKDAALAAADRAVAMDATIARAHSVRAEVLMERAQASDKPEDWKATLQAIVRANRADTEDPVPLAQFYRYHATRGGKMPDVGYDGLYKAYSLLPQSPDYRMNLARALGYQGRYAQASALLDPLAYSPHGSALRDGAIKLKAEMDAQAPQTVP